MKIHRQITRWGWFGDSECVHLLVYLLIEARQIAGKWRGHDLKRGELVAGRGALAAATGIDESAVRTRIMWMVDSGEIRLRKIKTEEREYGVISIVNYDEFQREEKVRTFAAREDRKIYTEYTADFEAWWKVYKKGVKHTAFQAWMKQLELLPPIDDLINRTKQYKTYCAERDRPMMDGQGWLNQRYFESDWTHDAQGTKPENEEIISTLE